MLGRVVLYWGLALQLLVSQAHAQTSVTGKAAAEVLFDRGLELMRAGKLSEACEHLEQSQAISVGIGTMLYLAECYERLGRTASAWVLFREAASAARAEGQFERAQKGKARADLLEASLSKLSVQMAQENRLSGLTVTVNGAELVAGVWGMPVPVDPGVLRVEVRAPGYQAWTTECAVSPGDSTTLVVPALTRDEVAPAAVAPPSPTPPAPPLSAAPSTPERQAMPPLSAAISSPVARPEAGWSAQRTVSIAIGATGAVVLGLGTYFGVRAISRDRDADALCEAPAPSCSSSTGVQLAGDANRAATVSNILVFGGAALVATAVILYLTVPSEHAPALAVRTDPTGARLTLRGSF
jgi:serine/threonine-protein kinase